MLHDYHRLHSAAGGKLAETGAHYDTFVPKRLQHWMYTLGVERGCYDALLERFVLTPVRYLSCLIGWLEPADWAEKWRAKKAEREAGAIEVNKSGKDEVHV
jgi:hypothetical protein